jgi:hypothetical protein
MWINWGHVQADGSKISCETHTVYIPSIVLLHSSFCTVLVVIYNSYASKLSRLPSLSLSLSIFFPVLDPVLYTQTNALKYNLQPKKLGSSLLLHIEGFALSFYGKYKG